MKYLFLDIAGTLLVTAGIVWIGNRLFKMRPEDVAEIQRQKGRKMAERLMRESMLVCSRCDKPVDPDVDVYHGKGKSGAWWHAQCYREIIN